LQPADYRQQAKSASRDRCSFLGNVDVVFFGELKQSLVVRDSLVGQLLKNRLYVWLVGVALHLTVESGSHGF
jgi:hypothetical protein